MQAFDASSVSKNAPRERTYTQVLTSSAGHGGAVWKMQQRFTITL